MTPGLRVRMRTCLCVCVSVCVRVRVHLHVCESVCAGAGTWDHSLFGIGVAVYIIYAWNMYAGPYTYQCIHGISVYMCICACLRYKAPPPPRVVVQASRV